MNIPKDLVQYLQEVMLNKSERGVSMKHCEGDDLIIELQEIKDALNVMAAGVDAYNDSCAASCMNIIQRRLEQIIDEIREMSAPPK